MRLTLEFVPHSAWRKCFSFPAQTLRLFVAAFEESQLMFETSPLLQWRVPFRARKAGARVGVLITDIALKPCSELFIFAFSAAEFCALVHTARSQREPAPWLYAPLSLSRHFEERRRLPQLVPKTRWHMVHSFRERAERAERLARSINDQQTCDALLHYARECREKSA